MLHRFYTSTILLVTLACLFVPGHLVRLGHGPPEDGLDWIDNTVVPEPREEGARWWYTPSRKAHFYSAKYERKLKNELQKAGKVGEDLRLPTDVLPSLYNIQLLPFIEEGNFTTNGHVDIFIDCVRATRNISFHAAEITFDHDSIKVMDVAAGEELLMDRFIDEQNTRQIVTIQLANSLEPMKEYKISIDFVSLLNDQLRGFYRSSYTENNVKKYLAVTQMEAPDARRAFPCFDEPNMKAKFSVTLGRKTSMKTASNMRILSTSDIPGMPGYVWDSYETSLKMSTYLVAFLVSEFVPVPAAPGLGRVPFRLWTRPDYVSQAEYSLDRAPRQQKFFEEYFETPYPMPKQDLAAIPDFSAGAMENWGLVTYRESALLINPATSPRTSYQSVAAINGHELAHQWFGDLVTTDWWNTIWLNEGFASYVEYLGTNEVEPDWMMMDQYITSDLHYVFGVDSLETSRPIQTDVTTNSEISAMFDSISYEKGGAIIRMMSDFLGQETFRKGLVRYLNTMAYDNAVQDDLWQGLQEQSRQDGISLPATVKEIMDTWTLQMGYPVINVTRDYSSNTAVVTQERFLSRKSENSDDTHEYKWWVPLTYSHPTLTKGAQWLSPSDKSKTITIQGAVSNQWLLFNVDQYNYYRVAYDAVNYEMLAAQLMANHTSMSIKTRGQLLDDAFNLAAVDMVSYKAALDLTHFLEREKEYVPWRAVLAEMDYIDIMLYETEPWTEWRNHLIKLITPYYEHVGFAENANDAHLTVYSRTDATNWACRLEVPDCLENAKRKYADLMKNPNMMFSPNEGRSLIIRTGVEFGGQPEWDFAMTQYVATGDTTYLTAMCNSREATRINSLLEMMLDSTSSIRRSDINTLFSAIASTGVGNKIAFDFLVNRWNDIEAALGNDYFVNFYYYLRNRLNTQEDLDRYIKLRDDHSSVLGNSNNVEMAIEIVKNNVKWMELQLEEITNWLENPASPTFPPTTKAPPTGSGNIIRPYSPLVPLFLVVMTRRIFL